MSGCGYVVGITGHRIVAECCDGTMRDGDGADLGPCWNCNHGEWLVYHLQNDEECSGFHASTHGYPPIPPYHPTYSELRKGLRLGDIEQLNQWWLESYRDGLRQGPLREERRG